MRPDLERWRWPFGWLVSAVFCLLGDVVGGGRNDGGQRSKGLSVLLKRRDRQLEAAKVRSKPLELILTGSSTKTTCLCLVNPWVPIQHTTRRVIED